MSGQILALLAAQVVIFAAWVYAMFRMVFTLRKIAVEDTGKLFPGPISYLAAFTAWLHDPKYRTPRKILILLTIALFSTNLIFAHMQGFV